MGPDLCFSDLAKRAVRTTPLGELVAVGMVARAVPPLTEADRNAMALLGSIEEAAASAKRKKLPFL